MNIEEFFTQDDNGDVTNITVFEDNILKFKAEWMFEVHGCGNKVIGSIGGRDFVWNYAISGLSKLHNWEDRFYHLETVIKLLIQIQELKWTIEAR